MIFLILFVTLVVALALYLRKRYSRFDQYGVKYFKPIPVLGNMTKTLFGRQPFVENIQELYNHFPNERFVGRYEFMSPTIVVKDIELLKKITVKDFEHFLDHRTMVDEKTDPFFGRNLFSLNGQEWKDMRSTISPAFTSSKMKMMLPFMVEVGDQMVDSLKNKIKESQTDYIDIELRDMTARYATDVIASCVFGLKVDSLVDEKNEFYAMGLNASNFNIKQLLTLFAMINFPYLTKKLKLSLFDTDTKTFFKQLVMNTMNEREAKNIIRPDMIHQLMEAKKGTLQYEEKSDNSHAGFATVEESSVGKKKNDRAWSDNDLVAQVVLFFTAGFDTVSLALTFTLYELAVNPDIQDRLVAEIQENEKKNNGKFDYNSIQEMVYMDMVVSEGLRLWPPGFFLDRVCIKDYNLGRPNDKATEDYIIRKGEGLHVSVWSIHRDPEFFPDPLKFDPERFSDKNKHKIKSFSYMPFGLGPRNCIGSRFALCEIKVMLYQLLLHMRVSPSDKTTIPPELSSETFNIHMKGGHWIRMSSRN